MITFLRGTLVHKAPPLLVMEVRGVGYELEAPMTTFYQLPAAGGQLMLHTHLLVREDSHSLYGFAAEDDRALFRLLLKTAGVGPKLALALLSGLSADEFGRCVANNDSQALQRLPGVGKKTAERLLVELRGRWPGKAAPAAALPPQPHLAANPKQEAIAALCSLGYKPQEAAQMVQGLAADGKSCEDLIRLALQGAARC